MKCIKKAFALLLALLLTTSALGCNSIDPSSIPETVEKKDYSKYTGIVEDPTSWYDSFMQLPVANDSMTEQELRQLCVDAFEANLTFCWTPNAEITYTYELLDKYYDVCLPVGLAYSGLFYATGIQDATCGNIWKILPFYDKETGVVDVEAMGDNVLNYFTSACSYGAIQAWNRVSNSHGLTGMSSYNKYDANIVPVGPYSYEVYQYNYNFGSRTASNEIIAANGNETMLESFAQMKRADGVYSSSSWHVMMCCEDPVVVRHEDGSINSLESYVLVHEQGAGGTRSDNYNYKLKNGSVMRPLGTINNKYTFQKLLEMGYIPFTLKEFTGDDPVEPGQVWLGTEEKPLTDAPDMTVQELFNQKLSANYNICTILVEVKAPDGTVLVSYVPAVLTAPMTYSVDLLYVLQADRLGTYANGKNTIHISAQLSNGELKEAYSSVLKMN